MNNDRPKQSGPCCLSYLTNCHVIDGHSKYIAKAWECGARAQVVSDPRQRAELLSFAGMWVSLTEPTEDDLRGAYEVPAMTATDAFPVLSCTASCADGGLRV